MIQRIGPRGAKPGARIRESGKVRSHGSRPEVDDLKRRLLAQSNSTERRRVFLDYLSREQAPEDLVEIYGVVTSDSEKASIVSSALEHLGDFDKKWEMYHELPPGEQRQYYCSQLVVQEFMANQDFQMIVGRLEGLSSREELDASLTNLIAQPAFRGIRQSSAASGRLDGIIANLDSSRSKKFLALMHGWGEGGK